MQLTPEPKQDMNVTQTVPFTLAPNYVTSWGFWEALRELIQNAVDCKSYNPMEDYELSTRDNYVRITTRDGAIPLEALLLGNGDKANNNDKVGGHGEGMKLAFLVLTRMGYNVTMANGLDKWSFSFQPHPELKSDCLTLTIQYNYYDCVDWDKDTVKITVQNLKEEDTDTLLENYIFPENYEYMELMNHNGNHIFRYESKIYEEDRVELHEEKVAKKVFVKGLYVCDLPDKYCFSYNLQPDKLKLDRDRSTVDTWDLQYTVAGMLEDAGEFELMVRMSEEKVPDLYQYYSPSSYKRVTSYHSDDEKVPVRVDKALEKLASDSFVKKYGENAIAVSKELSQSKLDILSVRAKLVGVKLIQVNINNLHMLSDDLKNLPEGVKVRDDRTPLSAVRAFGKANLKHMRGRAKKDFQLLLDELVMRG